MKPEIAAGKIQRFFTSYQQQKKQALNHVIDAHPAQSLLLALDLRFQCMRAVAAAKLPIDKAINDPAQVARVIQRAQEIAQEKGITNIGAIAGVFSQNITLAESIQASYYHLIWKKSHQGVRDLNALVNGAYKQLCSIIEANHLDISCAPEKGHYTSAEVLMLARDIIQHAGNLIIESLATLAQVIEQMLSNYMTPNVLRDSTVSIHAMVESAAGCSIRQTV